MLLSPLLGENPQSGRHRWLMAHMLAVAAFEVRHPVVLLILMKTDNFTRHDRRSMVASQDLRVLSVFDEMLNTVLNPGFYHQPARR